MTTANKALNEPISKSLNWNTPLNANFSIIDKALGGKVTIDTTGISAVPVVLTSDQYQNLIIAFTGILTANVTYQVPSGVGGEWIVSNATSGAFSVTVANVAGGASTVIAQGETHTVYSEGTGVYLAETALSVSSIPNAVTVQPTSAATNTVTTALTLDSQSSGTPAAGIGAGMAFAAETAAGTTKTGMLLQAVTTDVTTGSEDFDCVLKLMAAGATAAEALRVTSTGAVSSVSVTGDWVATQAEAEAGTNNDQIMTPLRTDQQIAASLGFSNRYVSSDTTIALNGLYTFTHALGTTPTLVQLYLVCIGDDRGWLAGDILPFTNGTENYNANVGPAVAISSTYIKVRLADSQLLRTIGIDSSTRGPLSISKWKLRVVAWA